MVLLFQTLSQTGWVCGTVLVRDQEVQGPTPGWTINFVKFLAMCLFAHQIREETFSFLQRPA